MPDERPADDAPDEQAVASFAARLDELAATLPPRERLVLETMLLTAMDPIERARWRTAGEVLSPAEEALLNELAERGQEG